MVSSSASYKTKKLFLCVGKNEKLTFHAPQAHRGLISRNESLNHNRKTFMNIKNDKIMHWGFPVLSAQPGAPGGVIKVPPFTNGNAAFAVLTVLWKKTLL